MASTICIVDYFFNPKTFDKLVNASRVSAFQSLDSLRRAQDRLPAIERAESQQRNAELGRAEYEDFAPQLRSGAITPFSLSASGQLHCYSNATLQLDLRLLDPIAHTTQIVALFGVIVTACMIFWAWGICMTCPDLVGKEGVIGSCASAVVSATFLFAVWAVLYHVAKSEIEQVLGIGAGTGRESRTSRSLSFWWRW